MKIRDETRCVSTTALVLSICFLHPPGCSCWYPSESIIRFVPHGCAACARLRTERTQETSAMDLLLKAGYTVNSAFIAVQCGGRG